MTETHEPLYRRICAYSLEGADLRSFVQKLTSENGWSLGYAKRAIDEYRRFMFLAVATGHPVAPSDQVDQVWHLHLTYTRTYWGPFCGDVLGTPIHHAPSRGGLAEAQKFGQWYDATIQSYHRLFGEPPPPDVWPDPRVRVGEDVRLQRINTRRHWIIQKPRVSAGCWVGGLVVASTCAAALVRSRDTSGIVAAQFEFIGENLYGVGLTAVVGVLFILSFIRQRRCTRCGRFWVFRPSGFSDESGRYSRDEYECDDCGHREWKRRSGDGGSGCGGAGGCGGGCGGD